MSKITVIHLLSNQPHCRHFLSVSLLYTPLPDLHSPKLLSSLYSHVQKSSKTLLPVIYKMNSNYLLLQKLCGLKINKALFSMYSTDFWVIWTSGLRNNFHVFEVYFLFLIKTRNWASWLLTYFLFHRFHERMV